MNQTEKNIVAFLENVKSAGNFVAEGYKDFVPLGLEIKDFGELALPVTPLQAQSLIKVAHKAPFGKGSETLIDDNVRKSWEIDASQVSFKNKEWNSVLKSIVENVALQLGVHDKEVTPSLYKLLIYEEGDFFTWHKDSEKEPNMFATLSITLPSQYEGSELVVRFAGKEEVVDMAEWSQNYKLAYSAFYADCDHEVKPLRKGYRITLVYNLLQKGKVKSSAADSMKQVSELVTLLKEWEAQMHEAGESTKIVLLEHQYTPTNFSTEHLKLSDLVRVDIMKQAAKEAGLFMRLGLMTHYKSGEIDYDSIGHGKRRRSSWYDDDDEDLSDASMGDEVFEKYSTFENWADDGLPKLGTDLNFKEEEVLTSFQIGEGDPLEKEAEGYTGNAGMTIDYWYHYGAMVLWSKRNHHLVLAGLKTEDGLAWLDYYAQNISKEPDAKENITTLLKDLNVVANGMSHIRYQSVSGNGMASAWLLLNDPKAFTEGFDKLVPLFGRIDFENWEKLMQVYPAKAFERIFQQVADLDIMAYWAHMAELLTRLCKDEKTQAFALEQIQKMPQYLTELPNKMVIKSSDYELYQHRDSHKMAIQKLLVCLFELNRQIKDSKKWADKLTPYFLRDDRDYVNMILAPVVVVSGEYKDTLLYQGISEYCQKHLEKRVHNKPQPKPDWTREIPNNFNSYHKKVWEILKNFMASPTEQVFEYRAVQADRENMEDAIKNAKSDLDMETIRKGSPHTLRLTKNHNEYKRLYRIWDEDGVILENVQAS